MQRPDLRLVSDTNRPRPTLENWFEPEHRAWGYQHTREIVPSCRIARSRDTHPLAVDSRNLGSGDVLGPGVTLEDYIVSRHVNGLLILQHGAIAYETYRHGMTARTPHLLMSVSKSVVASVTGILVSQGALAIEDLVTDRIPQLRRTAWEGCTVAHLLDMRAGIAFDESDDDPDSDLFVYEQIYQWRPLRDALPLNIHDYMTALPADGRHGQQFNYQSILTDMLGWILETVTGVPIARLIATLLWQPIGAEDDADLTVDRHGNAQADGGLCATLRDIARVGELWRNGGKWRGRVVIPSSWIEETLHPQWLPRAAGTDEFYSRNWWVVDSERALYAARGYCGQAVYVDTASDLVVAIASAWPAHTMELEDEAARVVRGIAALLS